MTSPRITSMFSPPACISVLSWSKRCPVSAAPSRKVTLYLPSFCSLNLWTSLPAVSVSSGAEVKTSSIGPPPCCCPPPHPAVPSNAAPASPVPPTLRKSRRESLLDPVFVTFMRSSFSLSEQPLVVWVVLDLPLPHRPGHDVQVVEVVAGGRGDRVVALRDQHHVPVIKGECLVERAVLGVDPLQREALLRADPVVVSLLQVCLVRAIIPIVLVRRVAGVVAVRGKDLHDEQPLGRAILHQDRVYTPLHVPLAPDLHLDVLGFYQQRLRP